MAARRKKPVRKKTARQTASKSTVKSVQSAISKKKLSWTAGDTSVSAVGDLKAGGLLGYKEDEKELNDLRSYISAANRFEQHLAIGAPAAVDWRNNNGNWVSSIKDQKACGSCVAFATNATVESRFKLACRDAGRDLDLSESFLFFCGCGNCCGTGWNFQPALDFAKDRGIALERDWPYQDHDQPCRSDVQPYLQINSWRRVVPTNERKAAIAQSGPVIAGMKVFSDFSMYQGGVYEPSTTSVSGYHAVSVVGYDDAQNCWICKNSWGPGWGENGFFRIRYGTSEIDTTFPFYELTVDCREDEERPSDRCREFVPYLIRVIRVARRNPRFRRCLAYHVCGELGIPPICPSSYMAVIRSVDRVLSLCPQYRAPFCRALR